MSWLKVTALTKPAHCPPLFTQQAFYDVIHTCQKVNVSALAPQLRIKNLLCIFEAFIDDNTSKFPSVASLPT